MKLLELVLKKNKKMNRDYKIGPYLLSLPKNHKLDSFQNRFPRYDFALGEIARILYQFYPQLTAIDIGANVGDTAALICKYQKIPVLCIEGAPQYLEMLNKNIKQIDSSICVKECFLGTGKENIPSECKVKHGSFSLVTNPKEIEKTENKTLTLDEVIKEYSQFKHSKLIKIDTDGFDFKILLSSLNVIKQMRPVLFWEHDICFTENGCDEAEHLLKELAQIDYPYFVVYDNFGNFLCTSEGIEKFEELNLYLLSNKFHSRIIAYFDICAIPKEMKHIFDEIKQFELSLKKAYLKNIIYPLSP